MSMRVLDDGGVAPNATELSSAVIIKPAIKPGKSYRELVEMLTWAAAPATVAFLALSVVHEWGYFFVVGRGFQSLLTTTDYLSNAIAWLPGLLVGAVFFCAFDPVSYFWKWEISAPKLGKQRRINIGVNGFLSGMVLGISITNYYFSGYLDAILVVGFLLILGWIKVTSVLTKLELSSPLYQVVRIVPILLILSSMLGAEEGRSCPICKDGNVYFLKLKHDEATHPAIVLRNLDRGLLVLKPLPNEVAFYRWEDIESFHKWTFPPDDRPILCRWFGRTCSNPDPPL
jgi:hypothetical protein